MPNIPVMRPKLPVAERLVGYLRRIDAARFYSNFGPLALALEDRLAEHYGLGTGTVTTVANATLGLALTLAAQGAKPGTLCAMPAWTFIASAHAVVNAGLVPYFIDVDPDTWSLDPSAVADEIVRAPAAVGAVMPVAPFGRPVDVAAWDAFRARTGLPVAIDAAAGFDSLIPGATPAVVSLHATKVLGTGEGGFVVSTDTALVRRVRMASNFGIDPNRRAIVAATNAKMSEYHAAVGHAALDEWAEARAQWMAVARLIAARSGGRTVSVSRTASTKPGWRAPACCVPPTGPRRGSKRRSPLPASRRAIGGAGAHAHPATAQFPHADLPVTAGLVDSTFAVPFYRDLDRSEAGRIAEIMLAAV